MTMQDERGLDRAPANHVPLSPLSFLSRARDVYGHREALVYGTRRYTWRDVHDRCARLAAGLAALGVGRGDVVSVLAANTPEMVEAHFGVPMAGAVLNTVNMRLDAETVAYILGHAGTKVLLADTQFAPVVRAALAQLDGPAPVVIDIVDAQAEPGERLGVMDYEALLDSGQPENRMGAHGWTLPPDEWDAITLNYTSGTSGRPKGVVYHHRGSYLMSLGTVAGWGLSGHPRYLYTVPMFHCNGWGHAWTMAALGGTIFCLRAISAKAIFAALDDNRITHFGGAPVVLGMLVNAPEDERREIAHPVSVMTAGAPPPAAILERMQRMGFTVMQVYGLTETYGHVIQCAWREDWDALPFDEQAAIKARQGVGFPMTEAVTVVDVETRQPVPQDGETQGEILIRGNTVMKGYYRDPEATAAAFADGAFRSGDIAVVHPDGYVEVRDRLKDVIISGGENVSSVEVEGVIYQHPAVAAAAVVARPDDRWGEVPCAFIELREGMTAEEAEVIAFCRERMAGFKTPKRVIFTTLPKTATGKIQKFQLRERARAL